MYNRHGFLLGAMVAAICAGNFGLNTHCDPAIASGHKGRFAGSNGKRRGFGGDIRYRKALDRQRKQRERRMFAH